VRERYLDKALYTFSDDHEFVAKAYFKSGVLFGNALEFTSSQMYLIKSQKIQMKRTPFDEGFAADTLDALGIVAGGVEARLDDSVNYFEQSIKIKEVCASVHPSSLAKTLNFLAIVKDAKGEFKTANELYEKAISIFQRHGVSNGSDFATLLNNYSIVKLRENGGLVFGKSNPFNSSKPEFKRAKDIMAGAYQVFLALSATNLSPSLAIILNNLGIAYHNLNDREMAAESFLKSHHICVELLGEKHPDVATALNNQAALLSCFNHDDEALSLYWQSFRIYKEALGGNHPHVARCLNNLGVLEHERDNLDEARRLYDMAYEIYRSTLGHGHCDTAQIQNNLALLEIQAGHLQSGSTLLKKVLDARIKSLGANHPQVGNSYIHLSRALSVQHEYEESKAYLMKGINLIQQWVDSQDCIRYLNDERLALAHKGQLVQVDVLCCADDISTCYDQDIHKYDFAKFLQAYIDSLRNVNLHSRNKNQLKSVSGSFLRMQLEVLDIGFANPISTQIIKNM
jgi:tetratricopeptide (TPR) repeat protein